MAPDPKPQETESQEKQLHQRNNVLVYEAPPFFDEDSKVPQWMQNLFTDVFNFVTVHYFVWSWPFLGLFYYLHTCELDYVSVVMVALYLPSFFSGAQKTGKGNVWDSIRTSSLWGLTNKFLRIKVIREQELDPKKKYIFGFHPHGIIVLSRVAIFGGNFDNVFPGIKNRLLGASAMYYVPLGREMCLWMGGVDASRSTGEKVLKEGNSIIVYPGGVPEIFRTDPNSKEYVEPTQERDRVLPLGIPVLVFWGKFWWLPKAPAKGKRYGLAYGKLIAIKPTENPTDEEVRVVHAQYVAEIHRIFEQYKSDFGYEEDETLAII